MNKKEFGNWLEKHAKKIALFMLMVTGSAHVGGQNTKILAESDTTEVKADDYSSHQKYDPFMVPHVETSASLLPVMSVRQAILTNHKMYVGHFNEQGNLEVFRTDCRYVAAGDALSAVFRRECTHNAKVLLNEENVCQAYGGRGFSRQEYLDWAKSSKHSLGEVVKDYYNPRKKTFGGAKGRTTIVVRLGFFQGGVNEWKQCLRSAYCSNNENMRKFAEHFIEDNELNRQIRDSVINTIYENNKMIKGENGVKKRMSVLGYMNKIPVKGISRKYGKYNCFSQEFCDLLRSCTGERKFDDLNKQNEYDKLVRDIAEMQERYVLNFYMLSGLRNRPAENADAGAAAKINASTGNGVRKVTPEEVKEKGWAIKANGWADVALFVDSAINGGAYFKGIHPGAQSGLKNFLSFYHKSNPCDNILTENFLFQAASLGIGGAEEAYLQFKSQVKELEYQEQNEADKLTKKKDWNTLKTDNIASPARVSVEQEVLRARKLKIPVR